jgi:hypothetical protein
LSNKKQPQVKREAAAKVLGGVDVLIEKMGANNANNNKPPTIEPIFAREKKNRNQKCK